MPAQKLNGKNTYPPWGVVHLVWHVPVNRSDIVVRLENGETVPVVELQRDADIISKLRKKSSNLCGVTLTGFC